MWEVLQLFGILNSQRPPSPSKRTFRRKIGGRGWPGRSWSGLSTGQGSVVFEEGQVRLGSTACRRRLMAFSPTSPAAGYSGPGLAVRRSDEVADLIYLFSKTQYRAKEISPEVREPIIKHLPVPNNQSLCCDWSSRMRGSGRLNLDCKVTIICGCVCARTLSGE